MININYKNMIKKEINIPKNPPQLIIIVGPCRVGTTALANIFTKIGITAYMQPIKSTRRAKEAGDKIIPWIINTEGVVVTKETIGSNTPAEFFDPVKILLNFGYPKERLVLIPIVRDPRKTLASWKEMWESADLQKFTKSYELTLKIKKNAERIGIKTIPYVHEAIRDQNPSVVIQRLFNRIGLHRNVSKDVIDWHGDAKFGEEDPKNSRLKFYDVPPERFIKEVKNWGSYQYREEPHLRLSLSDAKFLENSKKLKNIYEEFRQDCQNSLGLKIKPYDSVKS